MTLFFSAVAPSAATLPDGRDFFAYTQSLKEEGNRCYLMGDKSGISRIISLYSSALEERKAAGNISGHAYDSLRNEIRRLEGDYHYENSGIDTASFVKAEECFMGCLEYSSTHTSDRTAYRDRFIILQELAQLKYKQGRYEEALTYMEDAFARASNYHSPCDDTFLDIAGQLAMCLARNGEYNPALEYMGDILDNYMNKDTERYGEALRRKGKILMLRHESEGCGISDAIDCYRRYFSIKRSDALSAFGGMNTAQREEYWSSVRPFVTDCFRLEDSDASLLYDVALFSKSLLVRLDAEGGCDASIDVTWKDVQKALPAQSCAIEFIQYEKYGRQKMGALVLKRKGKPEFVPMPDPDDIYGRKVGGRTVSERLYNVRGTLKNAVYCDTGGLGRMLWNDALLKALGNASDVYFSPDGYLHQIAFEYMLPEESSGIRAHRLTGTGRLVQPSVSGPFSKVLFIGDADYLGKGFNVPGENDRQAYDYVKRMNCHFRPLAASKAEIDSIAAIWNSPDNMVLVDEDATEHAFRNLCAGADLLHISAHGLFGASSVPQGTDLKPCAADSTLSQSVLAFSGTQDAVDSDSYDSSLLDGLLSAKELSSLDLSGARLVVLACCETGLGYVTSDGVYGIQRGLKNAGAGAMVVSLWDVDDKATGIFMTALHRGLKNGMSIYDAFMAARSGLGSPVADSGLLKFNGGTLTCEYQDNEGYGEPRYKDAFILIDAVN